MSMGMALISLRDLTPLVTVSLELDEPGVPYIGRVETVSGETLTMLYIDADARYDEEATDYRLSEITRVNFGGGYEEALHLVSSARGGMGESSGFGAD